MIPRDAGSDPLDDGVGQGDRGPIRVLFANNYDMARARAGWLAGTYPGHHLYGTARLGSEFDIVDLPFSTDDALARATRRTRGKFGNIGQQLAAARLRRPGSVVYGAASRRRAAGRCCRTCRACASWRVPERHRC